MKRDKVTSRALLSIGYDKGKQLLEVEFTGGKLYRYIDVPEHEYLKLMSAPSRGTYLNTRIKDQYEYHIVGE